MARRHSNIAIRFALTLGMLIPLAGGEVRAMTEQLPGADPFPAELVAKMKTAFAGRAKGVAPRTRHRTKEGAPQFTNRLILESSPYLLQHAHNPVNWYPWGEEAFDAARKSNRPILLSIGYSTCHWCHVMEEESFEDVELADYINEHYVAIKVDREARPDLDAVYMAAVQGFTGGHGGWPMTLFLTSDRKPFYGGTYFPKDDVLRGGQAMPGLSTILRRLTEVVKEDPDEVERVANRVAESLARQMSAAGGDALPTKEVLSEALAHYRSAFDSEYAGLRQMTKFPANLPIRFLLRESDRTDDPEALVMATQTLDAMRKGGIYDQVGGGFHRYSTEPTWTVPHFEKMLYDNALLVLAYLEGYQATGNRDYAEVVRDVLGYLDREMSSSEGLFYAATDADSEGEEGRFFVWMPAQIEATVGAELTPLALRAYGVSEKGNFEGGRSILRRDLSTAALAKGEGLSLEETEKRLAEIRKKLYSARAKRVPPATDQKQIVGWNGLAISAFAQAGLVLAEPRFTKRALRAAKALDERAHSGHRFVRYLRDGVGHEQGVLEDYAYLETAYLDLFEVSSDAHWLDAALALQKALDEFFWDEKGGGYFSSASDGEALLVRQKSLQDGALPSGNAVAALNLLRLASLTADDRYSKRAEDLVRAFGPQIEQMPAASGEMLLALDFYFSPPSEVLVVAPRDRGEATPFVREFARNFLPNRVFLVASDAEAKALSEQVPLLEGKRALGGVVTAYVCENRTCSRPAKDLATFVRQLQKD